jgi:uncharacterized protein (TIGR03032 family)
LTGDPSKIDDQKEPGPKHKEIRFEYSPQLPAILEHVKSSILITTYQAGKLLVLGTREGKLNISFLDYDQPMGVAVRPDRIAVGTRRQMHFLVPGHETLGPPGPNRVNDGCFVPRNSFYTGNIHGHDLAWGTEGLWIVNTLFSCLATLHDDFSFVPRWRPNFISQLIDQDRCHLNGMALENGRPRYVTAMSETDQPAGWRPTKATGGIIIDVSNGEIISRSYSMPHSPRLYNDRLWVLNSGCGSFGYVDPKSGRYEEVETAPGYTRGLAFQGQFAFVGLSKIRETSVFGGVPIAERRDELQCGMGVIDLLTGRTVAVFKFINGVSEIFAVDVVPGCLNPLIAGGSVDKKDKEVWIVPAESSPRPKVTPHWPLYSARSGAVTIGDATAENSMETAQRLRQQSDLEGAAEALEKAVAELPRNAMNKKAALLVDLGNLRQDQAKQAMAATCYQRAVEVDSTCTAAWQNLGYLHFNRGDTEKAVEAYEYLLRFDRSPMNRLLDSSVLPIIYDSVDDIQYWRDRQLSILRGMVADRAFVDATKSLVPTCFLAAYQGLNDREVMALRGQVIRGNDYSEYPASRKSKQTDKPRIGFLSAYFRDHTIGKLNLPRLRKVDREQFHVTTILAVDNIDPVSRSFQEASDDFVLLPRDLKQAIQKLRDLKLDVLLFADVGMDSLTSTLAFSKFAPVQAVTWGHPDTTGSSSMDFFVTSRDLEVDDSADFYVEERLIMPTLGSLYDRPERNKIPKTRSQLGLPEDGRLYLCPQTLFKFHPEFDEAIVAIFDRDPEAYLILLKGQVSEWTHRLSRRWRRSFPKKLDRVRFLPAVGREDFLDLLAASDVVLDPYHFGGGNSTMECIAVGAPCVTRPGRFLRSRISMALHRQIGVNELIVHSNESYADLAVRIARDSDYRRSLHGRLLSGAESLYDNDTAVADWNAALARMVASVNA